MAKKQNGGDSNPNEASPIKVGNETQSDQESRRSLILPINVQRKSSTFPPRNVQLRRSRNVGSSNHLMINKSGESRIETAIVVDAHDKRRKVKRNLSFVNMLSQEEECKSTTDDSQNTCSVVASDFSPKEIKISIEKNRTSILSNESGKSSIKASIGVDARDEMRKAKRTLRVKSFSFDTQPIRRQSNPLIRFAIQNSSNVVNVLSQGAESNATTDNNLNANSLGGNMFVTKTIKHLNQSNRTSSNSTHLQLPSAAESRFESSNPDVEGSTFQSRESMESDFSCTGSSASRVRCNKVHNLNTNSLGANTFSPETINSQSATDSLSTGVCSRCCPDIYIASTGSSASIESCNKVYNFSRNFYIALNATTLTSNITTFKSLFQMKERSCDFFWYSTASLVVCSLLVQVGMAVFSLVNANRHVSNVCDEKLGWRWHIKYLLASVIMVINIVIAALSPV